MSRQLEMMHSRTALSWNSLTCLMMSAQSMTVHMRIALLWGQLLLATTWKLSATKHSSMTRSWSTSQSSSTHLTQEQEQSLAVIEDSRWVCICKHWTLEEWPQSCPYGWRVVVGRLLLCKLLELDWCIFLLLNVHGELHVRQLQEPQVSWLLKSLQCQQLCWKVCVQQLL